MITSTSLNLNLASLLNHILTKWHLHASINLVYPTSGLTLYKIALHENFFWNNETFLIFLTNCQNNISD